MKDGNLVTHGSSDFIILGGDMLVGIAEIIGGVSLAEVPGFLEAPGGAPANVAIAVARLGGKAEFVGNLGGDEDGRKLASILRENGVVYEGISSRSVTPGAYMVLTRIQSAKVFHYGSINLIGEPFRAVHLKAMKAAKDADLLLSYDPNLQLTLWPSKGEARERIMSIWDMADIIKVSYVEFEFLTGSKKVDDESAKSLLHPNLKLLLVTLEDLGCKYYTQNFHGEVEAFRVNNTVDTTGAGDSFVGALLCKIVDDKSILEDEPKLREALKFANACGAITTTKKGVVPALPTMYDALSLIGGA